ncbi:MAG: hypothetical protein ACI4MN_02265 [Candidatus Coproplasma sp.]
MKKLFLVKPNKMNDKEATQIFFQFATGALSTEEFWERYKSDDALRNVLIYDKKRGKPIKWKSPTGGILISRFDDRKLPINSNTLLDTIDINNLEHKYQLFVIINRYLISRGINLNNSELNKDIKEYLFLQQLLPEWVGVGDISFLQNLMATAPKQMSKAQLTVWGKSKIKELFKYDTKKPDWIQQPEWPIIDGRPLIFSHQETDEEGFEKYYFYDELSKQQVVIMQCG